MKKAAALANRDCGRLNPEVCEMITAAADEVFAEGSNLGSAQFPVDMMHGGGG